MKISEIFFLNLKKLFVQTKKALFLIIPVMVMIALSIVITSQVTNIKQAMDKSVFETISQQYTLLQLQTEQEEFNPMDFIRGGGNSIEENRFSEADVENIKQMNEVLSVSLQNKIPVSKVASNDLFDSKTVNIRSLNTLDVQAAKLYTETSFIYQEGEPIPIVLNANDFVYSYQDWGEQDEIVIDMSDFTPGQGRVGGGLSERMSFLKTEAIDYTKEDLIGKEIIISFGGLDEILNYTNEREETSVVISKLSDVKLQEKEDSRETAISEYWNYEKVSTPIEYKFVVVGILEDESVLNSYIPEEFSNVLMGEYVTNEIDARLEKDIPTEVLNSSFLGLTYDGQEISSRGNGVFEQIGRRMGGGFGRPGEEMETVSSYTIPGLVIVLDNNEVVGANEDKDIYMNSYKYGDTLSVVVDSIENRSEVIKTLNDAGYAYQDLGDLDIFENLNATLSSVSKGFLVSFVVMLSAIVAFTMSKFISESVKDIGIFRSLGMRQNSVLVMYMLLAFMYVLIGYLVGLLLGIGINTLVAGTVYSWFDSFIAGTVSQGFNVVNIVDGKVFSNISWDSVLVYSGILLIITILISIVPSISASKISPVEAIKSE